MTTRVSTTTDQAPLVQDLHQVDEDDSQSQKKEKSKCTVLRYQITVFAICYLSYAVQHVYREFWSISKPKIEDKEDKYHVTEETLSNVDFTYSMIYGVGQTFSGMLADQIRLEILMPINYACQAVLYALIAMTGFLGGEHTNIQLYAWFCLLGCVESMCSAAFVQVVVNWSSKRRRGIILAWWHTCINIGDIIGAQVGSAFLAAFNDKW